MVCATCNHPMATCTCPNADQRLHDMAYHPTVALAFKWCRACDKHYVRCRCATPDFFVISNGRDIRAAAV